MSLLYSIYAALWASIKKLSTAVIYNEKLSKNRAKALIRFFEENGLEKSRIVIDFKGEKQPVGSNKTPEGKQRNRRVDFTFI